MIKFYYPRTIKNVTIALLDLFNDVRVQRFDSGTSTTVVKDINPIPITYGPVEKFQQIRQEDRSLKKYYLQLPRLALTLDNIQYAAERVVSPNNIRYFTSGAPISEHNSFVSDIQPTPYDFLFTVHVRTDSMEDFSIIMENILPYFNPTLYLRVKEFSFLTIERDLPVILESTTVEFIEPQSDDETRQINGTVSLKVEGHLYRPVDSAKIIKIINTDYFVNADVSTRNIGSTSAADVIVDEFSVSGFSLPITSAHPLSIAYLTSSTNEQDVAVYTNVTRHF